MLVCCGRLTIRKTVRVGRTRELLDVDYRRAQRVTLAMDNMNTRAVASLYEAFEPKETRWLIERLEVVHTPKRRSWLNIAEIGMGMLLRQCMGRRIVDRARLTVNVDA